MLLTCIIVVLTRFVQTHRMKSQRVLRLAGPHGQTSPEAPPPSEPLELELDDSEDDELLELELESELELGLNE